MTTKLRDQIDDEIRHTARRRLGVQFVSIVRRSERDFSNLDARVDWQLLFVKRTAAEPWQLIGRRRSKAELLSMVSTIDPRRVEAVVNGNGPIGVRR